MSVPVALTIAGSDPSGGAGLQADLKTFHQFGVYGEAVVTLITVQNTTGVEAVECLDAGLVQRQIRAVLADIPPAAAKTGALGNAELVEAVAEMASGFGFPLVVDPVLISKHGAPLLSEDAREALIQRLLPHALLVTPNLAEAAALSGLAVQSVEDMKQAAGRILALGPRAVLVKGGHLADTATDVLLFEGGFLELGGERIETPHTHGTGCTYSAAITALLARGLDLPQAVRRAKRFITEAIRTNPGLGHGAGPVNHHAPADAGPDEPARGR
jgi:hydroxymethylpyrimidine/phosphomethylpyrimidine kinase